MLQCVVGNCARTLGRLIRRLVYRSPSADRGPTALVRTMRNNSCVPFTPRRSRESDTRELPAVKYLSRPVETRAQTVDIRGPFGGDGYGGIATFRNGPGE